MESFPADPRVAKIDSPRMQQFSQDLERFDQSGTRSIKVLITINQVDSPLAHCS